MPLDPLDMACLIPRGTTSIGAFYFNVALFCSTDTAGNCIDIGAKLISLSRFFIHVALKSNLEAIRHIEQPY